MLFRRHRFSVVMLVVFLVATGLVSSPTNWFGLGRFLGGNSASADVNRVPDPGLPSKRPPFVVAKPESFAGVPAVVPDTPIPDWFGKTDEVSRGKARAAQKAVSQVEGILPDANTEGGIPAGFVNELVSVGGSSGGSGDPVVVGADAPTRGKRAKAKRPRPATPGVNSLVVPIDNAPAASTQPSPVVVLSTTTPGSNSTTVAPQSTTSTSSSTTTSVVPVTSTNITTTTSPTTLPLGDATTRVAVTTPAASVPGSTASAPTTAAAPARPTTEAIVTTTPTTSSTSSNVATTTPSTTTTKVVAPLTPPRRVAGNWVSGKPGPVVLPPVTNSKITQKESMFAGPAPVAEPLTGPDAELSAKASDGRVVMRSVDDRRGAVALEFLAGSVGLRPLLPQKASAPKKSADGMEVSWDGALADGSQLVERVTGAGAKGTIVLTNAPQGDAVWDFELVLSSGLTPSQGPDGVIVIRDKSAKVIALLPVGDAIDANGVPTPVESALRQAKAQRWVVSYAVSTDWLDDPTRVYPVQVDPAISSAFYNTQKNFINSTYAASYEVFNQVPNPLDIKSGPMYLHDGIDAYVLRMYMVYFQPGMTGVVNIRKNYCFDFDGYFKPGTIRVEATRSGWDPSTLSWFNQPTTQWMGDFTIDNVGTPIISFSLTPFLLEWKNNPSFAGLKITNITPVDAFGHGTNCRIGMDSEYGWDGTANTPPTGTIISPLEGATGVPTQPSLTVSGSDPDNATLNYYNYLCTPNFSAPVACYNQANWTTSPTFVPAVLPSNTVFQWIPYVWDGVNNPVALGTRTFTTLAAGPSGISMFGPVDGSQNAGTANGPTTVSVSLDAAAVGGVAPYQWQVQVCVNAPGGACAVNTAYGPSPTVTAQLLYGTNYAWTVSVSDSLNRSTSKTQTFKTISRSNLPPGVASVTSPTAFATQVSETPQFTATATDPDGDSVQFQYNVCLVSNPASCIPKSPFVSGQWISPQLAYNTSYTVTALSRDALGLVVTDAVVSAPITFTTKPNPGAAVTVPVLVGPVAGSLTTIRPWIQASATDADVGDGVELSYQVCTPALPALVGGASQTPASGTKCDYSPWVQSGWQVPAQLDFGATYQWRAWARNTSSGTTDIGVVSPSPFTFVTGTSPADDPGLASIGWDPYVDLNDDVSSSSGVNEALGSFTTAATDAAISSVAPGLVVSRTYNSRNRRTTGQLFGPGWSSSLDSKLAYIPSGRASMAVSGQVVLEAEVSDLSTVVGNKTWNAIAEVPGSSGPMIQAVPNTNLAAIDTTITATSPRVDYQVNFATAGTYKVWIRGYGATLTDNSVHVGLDGTVANSVSLNGTGVLAWSNISEASVSVTVTVATAGLHTVNVWMREDGSIVDKIILTTNTSFVPTVLGAATSARQTSVASVNDPVVITMPDGRREYYTRSADGTYKASGDGFYGDLEKDPSGWVGFRYMTKDRTTAWFNTNGRLQKIQDRNGNALRYDYDATTGLLTQIQDEKSNRALTFSYNGVLIASVTTTPVVTPPATTVAALTWTYGYTNGLLTEVCPPRTATITGCWGYQHTDGLIRTVIKPKGNTDVVIDYATTEFVLTAPDLAPNPSIPNLAPNPSFESAASWTATGVGAGSGVSAARGFYVGAQSFVLNYGGAGTSAQLDSSLIAVSPSQQYTISARVKGTSTGKMSPVASYFDANQNLISTGIGAYGGESLWQTGTTFRWVRGQIRTPETAAFVKIGFKWPTEQGHNGDAVVDAVMFERGDGVLGRVTQRTDGVGNITKFAAIQNGANTEVRTDDPLTDGLFLIDIYNSKSQLIQRIDKASLGTYLEYDTKGFLNKITDPAGRVTLIVNDIRGNKLSETRLTNRTQYWKYQAGTDLPIEYRNERSTSSADNTYLTQYQYDGAGNLSVVTDPAGKLITTTYALGSEAALGGGTVPVGLLTSATNRNGKVVSYKYDRLGNLLRIVDPAMGTRVNEYDALGRLLTSGRLDTVTSTTQGITTNVYDVRGRVVSSTGPAILNTVSNVTHQAVLTKTYDLNNNPTNIVVSDLTGGDAARTTVTDFDNNERPYRVTWAGKVTTTHYDPIGRVDTKTDERGLITTTQYNIRNLAENVKLTNFWDAPGGVTRSITLRSFTYKPNLPLIDVETDALGRQVQSVWRTDDLLQQKNLLNYSPPTGALRNMVLGYYEYDNVGNPTLERRGDAANGVATTTRVFDANNFVTRQTQVETNRITTYGNDFEGRVKTATTGAYIESNSYDATSLLLTSTSIPGLTAGGPMAVTSYGYDQWGRHINVTDPRANLTTFGYDYADRMISTTSPSFNAWDATGATSATAQAVSRRGYDTFGSVTHRKDPRNLITSAAFDGFGRPAMVTYPTNGTITPSESFTYDLADNQLTMVDRRGFTTTNVFDALSRKRSTTQPPAATGGVAPKTLWDYDDVNQLTVVTDPNANKVANTYDGAGRLRTATNGFGSTVAATTTFDYDDLSNRTYVKDPLNNVSTGSFNAVGQPVTRTDSTGAATAYTYTASTGWDETITVAGARRSKFEYDPAGRLAAEKRTNPTGTVDISVTGFGYDVAGNRTSVTRPNGAVDTFTYDTMNRLLTSVTDIGLGATAATATSEAGYDIVGNMVRVKDANLNITTTEYNNWGLPSKVVEPSTTAHPTAANREWTVGYNAAGAPITEVRPGGVSVTKSYDNLNRLTGETGGGTGVTTASRTFGYDTGGRMTTVGGQTLSYDARNNLTGASGPQGTSTYVFDTANRMTSRTDAAGTSTFTWSPRSELKTTATNATTTSYNWLPSGELDTISYPGGTGRKYTYDDLGRSLTDTVTAAGTGGGTTVGSNGSVTAPVFAEGFSAAWWGYAVDDVASGGNPGRMLSRPNSVQGDGVVVSTGVVATAFTTVTFDVKGAVDVGVYANSEGQGGSQLASRKVTPSATAWTRYTCSFAPRSLTATWNQIRFFPNSTAGTVSVDNVEIGNGTQPVDTCQLATTGSPGGGGGGGVVLSSRVYTYNPDSTVASSTVTQAGNTAAGLYTYAYDRGSRLRSMTAPNIAVTSYTYDAAGNRLTAGASSFTYDQRNRLMSGPGAVYDWTPRGTLASITGTGAAAYVHDGLDRLTQAGTVSYGYDSLNRVTTRTVAAVVTAFSYAGVEMDPVAEGTATKYLRGPSGQSVHGIIRNGTLSFAGADRHGDVSFTLSTTGAVTDSKISDPFGKTLGSTGTGTNVGFQSDWTDPTNGLVWMGARWYNPQTATFTSRDTYPGSVGAYATLNRYTYGLNNPLKYSDPTGHVACSDDGCNGRSDDSWIEQAYSRVSSLGDKWSGGDIRAMDYLIDKYVYLPIHLSDTAVLAAQKVDNFDRDVVNIGNLTMSGNYQKNDNGSRDSLKAVLRIGHLGYRTEYLLGIGAGNLALLGTSGPQIVNNRIALLALTGGTEFDHLMYGTAERTLPTNSAPATQGLVDRVIVHNNKTAAILFMLAAAAHVAGDLYVNRSRSTTRGSVVGSSTRANNDDALDNWYDDALSKEYAATKSVSGACSFEGTTRVLMADGTSKPIDEVRVGDEVLAQDPETGEKSTRKVTHLWVHDDEYVRLEIGDGTVLTTANHPFWNDTDQKFERADELNVGDFVLTAYGHRVRVGHLRSAAGHGAAYNLTVEGLHTYHVLVGHSAVLVHNVCPTAESISNGHAFEKHVVERGEFPGVRTRAEFAEVIDDVMMNPQQVRNLSNGRTAYWKNGVVVIKNPAAGDLGTAFVPKDGVSYFNNTLK
jgi:RHS repeat-associated protein